MGECVFEVAIENHDRNTQKVFLLPTSAWRKGARAHKHAAAFLCFDKLRGITQSANRIACRGVVRRAQVQLFAIEGGKQRSEKSEGGVCVHRLSASYAWLMR